MTLHITKEEKTTTGGLTEALDLEGYLTIAGPNAWIQILAELMGRCGIVT